MPGEKAAGWRAKLEAMDEGPAQPESESQADATPAAAAGLRRKLSCVNRSPTASNKAEPMRAPNARVNHESRGGVRV